MWVVRQYIRATVALLLFGALLWFGARCEFFRLPDYARQMEPAMAGNSLYLLDQSARSAGDFAHSDVVFFSFETPRKYRVFASRVVGLPGEGIALRDGQLFRNAEPVGETYLEHPFPGVHLEEITVPRGCLYVLNDDRQYSDDSRTFGPIPWTAVLGRARK